MRAVFLLALLTVWTAAESRPLLFGALNPKMNADGGGYQNVIATVDPTTGRVVRSQPLSVRVYNNHARLCPPFDKNLISVFSNLFSFSIIISEYIRDSVR